VVDGGRARRILYLESDSATAVRISQEPSVELPSITMALQRGSDCAAKDASVAGRKAALFRLGMTISMMGASIESDGFP
jgi:hypothetical protein